MRVRLFCLAGALGVVLLAGTPAALAQTALDDSVVKRARPDYDPIGLQPDFLGSFVFFPKLTTSINSDDNIFRTDKDVAPDFIYTVSPSFALQSDWVSHGVNVKGKATIGRYFEEVSEDYEDFSFGFGGRLEIGLFSQATASFSHEGGHEGRDSPDDVGGAEPSIFFKTTSQLAGRYVADLIEVRASFKDERLNFRDNAEFDNDDRDRDEIFFTLRGSYEFTPGTAVFIEPRANWIIYDDQIDSDGFQRDNNGYKISAGLTIDTGGVTFLEFLFGFLSQSQDDPQLDGLDDFFGELKGTWNPTDLTTVNVRFKREIRQTTSIDSPFELQDTFGLIGDHELLENLLLNANFQYRLVDFIGVIRDDEILRTGVGVKYLMGSNFVWELRYLREQRDSNELAQNFVFNVALLKLTLRL